MNQLQPVLWSRGAFLQAQHLQYQDLYLEGLLRFRTEALNPHSYGFRWLVVDQEQLDRGYFALTKAAGIFPDGLLFDIPQSDRPPDPRFLADGFQEGAPYLDVYLGIPHQQPSGINVAFEKKSAEARYIADILLVRDENSGFNEKPVQVARRNLQYLVNEDDRKRHSTLHVARLLKKGDRALEMDPRFLPPLLRLDGSAVLVTMLDGLVALLSDKSRQLSEVRRQKNQSLADFTLSDTAGFWLLYTINCWFPWVRHLLDAPGAHPSVVYAAMAAMAGALTTFSLKIGPNDLPPYNHDDLGACFPALEAKLRELLNTAIPRYYVTLPLKATEQPYVYLAGVPEDRFLVDSRVYLAISTTEEEYPPQRLVKSAPQTIRVAALDALQDIIYKAVSGIPLSHVESVPDAIPMQLNYKYFELDPVSSYWQGIRRARNIAVYVPAETPNPKMEIVVLLKHEA
jgi:type VI secretion system protein ImpJ